MLRLPSRFPCSPAVKFLLRQQGSQQSVTKGSSTHTHTYTHAHTHTSTHTHTPRTHAPQSISDAATKAAQDPALHKTAVDNLLDHYMPAVRAGIGRRARAVCACACNCARTCVCVCAHARACVCVCGVHMCAPARAGTHTWHSAAACGWVGRPPDPHHPHHCPSASPLAPQGLPGAPPSCAKPKRAASQPQPPPPTQHQLGSLHPPEVYHPMHSASIASVRSSTVQVRNG